MDAEVSMRVSLLVPERQGSCGVVDYSLRLAASLAEAGTPVTLARAQRGGRLSLSALRAELRARKTQVLHIQYPMVHYGASLLPLIATQLRSVRTVVTLHEFSQSHVLRRAASMAFSRADALIFTTEPERSVFCRQFRWCRHRARVIPIGSNITPVPPVPFRHSGEICYFGQLRPRRGLEDFLALARLAVGAAPELRFRVLGAIPAGCLRYAQEILSRGAELPNLRCELELPEAEIAARLARTEFAYLPYPDGVSERRSTLLAAVASGALVVTRRGPQTSPAIADAVCLVDSPSEALVALRKLAARPAAQQALRAAAQRWLQGRDWATIAEAHRTLYLRLTGGQG